MISILGERLKTIRIEKKVSQRKLGLEFNTSQESISSYEQGKVSPSPDILLQYAKYFNVSIDYLFGLTDHKNYVNVERMNSFEEYIILKYREMSPQTKNCLIKICDALLFCEEENKHLFNNPT